MRTMWPQCHRFTQVGFLALEWWGLRTTVGLGACENGEDVVGGGTTRFGTVTVPVGTVTPLVGTVTPVVGAPPATETDCLATARASQGLQRDVTTVETLEVCTVFTPVAPAGEVTAPVVGAALGTSKVGGVAGGSGIPTGLDWPGTGEPWAS